MTESLAETTAETTLGTTLETTLDTTLETTVDSGTVQNILTRGIAGLTIEKLLTTLVAVAICLLVIRILLSIVDRALRRTPLDATIKMLVRGGLKALFVFVSVIVVLGYLDIPVTSLVAVLSVAGLALSLALQNFLSNVAGGLQLLVSQPFKIGDYVDIGGSAGTVDEMSLFYTKLTSIDYKLIQLPNSFVVSQNIINYSAKEKRRMELKITASYDAPVEKVRATLAGLLAENPLTLSDPEPLIHVNNYGDSAIEYIIRVWCLNKDYWILYYDLMDTLKPTFDREGIEITYPHLNVHMNGSMAENQSWQT